MTRAERLARFLRLAVAHHGRWNCSTDPADWCVALGYPDFAARWRDTVEPAACEAAPAEAGGLAVLWDSDIGDNLPRAAAPFAPGDIGVIGCFGFEAGGIFTGERWAIRTPRGMHFAALPESAVVAAWRP